MSELTHFDECGQAHMVNVGAKAETHRVAVASGRISTARRGFQLIASGTAKKGVCVRDRRGGSYYGE